MSNSLIIIFYVVQVRRDILESKAIPEAGEYLRDFGSRASKSLELIGKDEFYMETIQELLAAYST